MSKPPKDDQYSEEETKRRAEEALRGAFKTPPVQQEKKPRGVDKKSG
jgi:hypothetical protein